MHGRRSYSGNEYRGERLQKIVSEVMSRWTGAGRTVEVRIGSFSSFIIV